MAINLEEISYRKINLKQMMQYIDENDPSFKEEFKKACVETVAEKFEKVPKKNSKGEPVFRKNKKGETVPVMVLVPVEGSKVNKPRLNIIKAKKAFYNKFAPHLLPSSDDKKSALAKLLEW